MRFLPYVFVFFMLMPIAIWLIIDFAVLNGATTRFNGEQSYVLATLIPLAIVGSTMLVRWSSAFIKRTNG